MLKVLLIAAFACDLCCVAFAQEPVTRSTFSISYTKSDRKWKYGFRSEPYNQISDELQETLAEARTKKGLTRSPAIAETASCCVISLELIEVATHPAMVKKPGIDLTANLQVSDGSKHLMYSKAYRGESRTLMNTYGHLINHSVEAAVQNITDDAGLMKLLATGQTP